MIFILYSRIFYIFIDFFTFSVWLFQNRVYSNLHKTGLRPIGGYKLWSCLFLLLWNFYRTAVNSDQCYNAARDSYSVTSRNALHGADPLADQSSHKATLWRAGKSLPLFYLQSKLWQIYALFLWKLNASAKERINKEKGMPEKRQVRFGVQHYVNFYNAQRIHSALQYKTPDEVYFGTCNSANRGYISSRPFTPIF
jgi:hypothetical protein